MRNKEKNQICSFCGNSGGLGFLAVNENGEEVLVMTCWKCLVEKAAESGEKADEGTDEDGGKENQ